MAQRVSGDDVARAAGAARDALLDLLKIVIILITTIAAIVCRIVTEVLRVIVALAWLLARAVLIGSVIAASAFAAVQIWAHFAGGIEKAILIGLALIVPLLYALQHDRTWGALACGAAVTYGLGLLVGALDMVGHALLIASLLALVIIHHQLEASGHTLPVIDIQPTPTTENNLEVIQHGNEQQR